MACYVAYKESEWIQTTWEKETIKYSKSLNRDVTETFSVYGINAVLNKEVVHHKGKIMLET